MNSKTNYLVIWVLQFLIYLNLRSSFAIPSQYLISPCPQTFQYKFDEAGILYGSIQIECPDASAIDLNLEMTVGNVVKNYNGHIDLVYSKEQVINDILNKRPIYYKLHFPLWHVIPPRITKISVNDVLLCQGPPIPLSLVPVLTTITLKHRLTLNIANLVPLPKERVTANNSGIRNPWNFHPKIPKSPSTVHVYNGNTVFHNNPFLNPDRIPKATTTKNDIEIVHSQGTSLNFGGTFFHPNKPTVPSVTPGHNDISPNIESDFGEAGSFQQPFPDICGLPMTTNPLIVHGDNVPRGAYPWLVALFGVKLGGLDFRCSGSLITKKHIVTAAHCIKDEVLQLKAEELIIVLGRYNIQRWSPSDGGIMMEADDIAVHPDYVPQNADADIAIITLKEPVDFTTFIRPICLWSGPEDLELVTGINGTVVGWGRNENGYRTTTVPFRVTLPIVSQEVCLRSAIQFEYITSRRTFCAGKRNGVGPCNGDSGSGFILKRNDRWMLRGVVSMSISDPVKGACDLSNYVVFSDASKFTTWILSIIK